MEELISKSQKKRDATELQDLGRQFIELKQEALGTLPLTDGLRQAIEDAKRLKSHGAIRRQTQLIGKLMRSADCPAIMEAFAALQADDRAQTAQFHAAELWRKNLIHGGPSMLTEFIVLFHPTDIQQLRQLIKKASLPSATPLQEKAASKALFRYLRQYV